MEKYSWFQKLIGMEKLEQNLDEKMEARWVHFLDLQVGVTSYVKAIQDGEDNLVKELAKFNSKNYTGGMSESMDRLYTSVTNVKQALINQEEALLNTGLQFKATAKNILNARGKL